VVLSVEDHDHIGCFTDQVKLTHALVRDLDEAVKEVKLLGEHDEESSQKITELEALCKRLREDALKLKEEKATLEGMVESRDELIIEIAKEIRLHHMGEDAEEDDEEEDKDDDDGGDTTAPLLLRHPLIMCHLLLPHLRMSLLLIIKCIYLPQTYLHFIQDIEDRCLLLMSTTSFVDIPFQEYQMMEKNHMDQNPCISSLCPK
jgi:hypothetical protein